jgi:hypothetical protein
MQRYVRNIRPFDLSLQVKDNDVVFLPGRDSHAFLSSLDDSLMNS